MAPFSARPAGPQRDDGSAVGSLRAWTPRQKCGRRLQQVKEAILSSFATAPRCRLWIAALLAVVVGCGGAERADKLDIAGRYTAWQAALTEQRMADAYAIMSPGFRTLHSLAEFEQLFGRIAEDFPTLPSRYEVRFEATDDGMLAYFYPFEDNWIEFRNGVELEWLKVASRWYLTGELKYFRR